MNKRISSLAAVLTLAGLGSAVAADLPARTYTPAPAYVVPMYNWTGFYIGGNVGAVWGNGQLTEFVTGATFSNTRSNFTGGGQIGYNYQFANNVVLGVEWMFDWTGHNSGTNVVPTAFGALQVSGSGTQWYTTVAGRLGYAVDRTLFYAKGGGAWVETSATISNLTTATSFTANKTRSGFVVGAGIEYALTQNWTIKGEYDFLGVSSWTNAISPVVPAGQFKISGNVQNFVVGVNYKF